LPILTLSSDEIVDDELRACQRFFPERFPGWLEA
jgi:hypothetical protein